MGFGLYTTAKLIEKIGKMFILHSGSHKLMMKDGETTCVENGFWQGTLIYMEIGTAKEIDPNQVVDHRVDAAKATGRRPQVGNPVPSIPSLDTMSTDELSQHIRSVIIRERLYLSTQFDRQAAIDYFHLSKERIGAAFSQGSEFPTIADFINHCRLEYAKELLAVSPEMTVDDIASASGFGTRRTFSRLFKERYSITPTEYRNQNKDAGN
jgi:AraC-like DNA-binding protein